MRSDWRTYTEQQTNLQKLHIIVDRNSDVFFGSYLWKQKTSKHGQFTWGGSFGLFCVNKGLSSIQSLQQCIIFTRLCSVYLEFICAFNTSSVNNIYYICNGVNCDSRGNFKHVPFDVFFFKEYLQLYCSHPPPPSPRSTKN